MKHWKHLDEYCWMVYLVEVVGVKRAEEIVLFYTAKVKSVTWKEWKCQVKRKHWNQME